MGNRAAPSRFRKGKVKDGKGKETKMEKTVAGRFGFKQMKGKGTQVPCIRAARARAEEALRRAAAGLGAARMQARALVAARFPALTRRSGMGESGQGTTEYAILVGVLVVIAILAITVFRPKIQELWDAIANGINSL